MVVGGGETQQELIPLKHKEWSVVDLVLSELTMTGMALEGTALESETHEAPVKLLRIR